MQHDLSNKRTFLVPSVWLPKPVVGDGARCNLGPFCFVLLLHLVQREVVRDCDVVSFPEAHLLVCGRAVTPTSPDASLAWRSLLLLSKYPQRLAVSHCFSSLPAVDRMIQITKFHGLYRQGQNGVGLSWMGVHFAFLIKIKIQNLPRISPCLPSLASTTL